MKTEKRNEKESNSSQWEKTDYPTPGRAARTASLTVILESGLGRVNSVVVAAVAESPVS